MLHEILFYSFGVFALTTGFFVVVEKNPIHAVFFLVLCFVNAAGMLLMVGAEFLAFLLSSICWSNRSSIPIRCNDVEHCCRRS